MPLYDYVCKACGKEFDDFVSVAQRAYSHCPECSGLSFLKFNPSNVMPRIFTPYWDEHISEDPVFIETRAQKKDILKSEGLVESG